MEDRSHEILEGAKAIITAIEDGSVPLSRIGLRARRLAQIVDDEAAFFWLNLECAGAAPAVRPERPWRNAEVALTGYEKWKRLRAVWDVAALTPGEVAAQVAAGDLPERSKTLAASLASLEVMREELRAERMRLAEARGGEVTQAQLLDGEVRRTLETVASAIHEWATGVYIAHRFREFAGNIFDRFKTSSDARLAQLCPDALNKLNHAIERGSTENPEAWSAAAMSCRRVLKDFADAVYPPKEEAVDGHDVTAGKYINRLYAFAKEHGGQALALEELEGLGKVLDRMYELGSKGVHASITKGEVDVVILRTYILLSQLAQLIPAPSL